MPAKQVLPTNYDAHGAFAGFDKWVIKNVNVRGQITNIKLGTGHEVGREYDTFGNLQTYSVFNPVLRRNDIENTYSFDPIRGNLLGREHKFIGQRNSQSFTESFVYDDQDRLIRVSGPFAQKYTYDIAGRMTASTDLGNISYQSGESHYRLKSIDLNPERPSLFCRKRETANKLQRLS